MKKKEIITRCREILSKGGRLIDSKIEETFLKELLRGHPHYKMKKGCGIKKFLVRKNKYGNLGFYIIRVDNSTTDFSFYQCIRPRKKETKIKMACRNSIKEIIWEIKKVKTNVLHHDNKRFNDIVLDWLKDNPSLDLQLNKASDNCEEIYFINPQTIKSFIKYHNKFSKLIEVSPEQHKLIHKKK